PIPPNNLLRNSSNPYRRLRRHQQGQQQHKYRKTSPDQQALKIPSKPQRTERPGENAVQKDSRTWQQRQQLRPWSTSGGRGWLRGWQLPLLFRGWRIRRC
ncbi:unnamed protein product, partial [Ectocarpus fasciculatus]